MNSLFKLYDENIDFIFTCFTTGIFYFYNFFYNYFYKLSTIVNTNSITLYISFLRICCNIEKQLRYFYNINPYFKNFVDISIYIYKFIYLFLLNKKIEPYNNNWVCISLLNINDNYQYDNYQLNESYDFFFNLINNITTNESTNIDFATNESTYIDRLKYYLLEKRFYNFCEYSKNIFDYSNNIKEIMVTMQHNNKYIHYNFYKGKYNYTTIKFPNTRSVVKFITVKYIHPMMINPIYLELNNIYFKNNRILSPCFVKRLLEYQPIHYFFDMDYTLEIIDNNIKTINLKSTQYIELNENTYRIVDVE